MKLSESFLPGTRSSRHKNAYIMALLHNEPSILQTYLTEDLRKGICDQYTRSAFFWIVHRYFDNGGNIHEARVFIDQNPLLTVLAKDARDEFVPFFRIPDITRLPTTYSLRSRYLLVAYYEVAERYQLGSFPARATTMNQHAYAALYSLRVPSDFATRFPHHEFRAYAIERAMNIQKGLNDAVSDLINGKILIESLPAADVLVTLNQYAAGLRHLALLGAPLSSTSTARDIFAFNMRFSRTTVPELEHFTALLNASTLNLSPEQCTDEELTVALEPIYSFRFPPHKEHRRGNVIDRILELPRSEEGGESVNMYDRKNITRLAERVPEFKDWLSVHGWDN